MYDCGFSVPQIEQFFLLTYPPRSKSASSEKMFFFFAKISIFCKSIAGPLPSVVQAYIQPYSFGGRIKLIICQIKQELSVIIHEIGTIWKKKHYMAALLFCFALIYCQTYLSRLPFNITKNSSSIWLGTSYYINAVSVCKQLAVFWKTSAIRCTAALHRTLSKMKLKWCHDKRY